MSLINYLLKYLRYISTDRSSLLIKKLINVTLLLLIMPLFSCSTTSTSVSLESLVDQFNKNKDIKNIVDSLSNPLIKSNEVTGMVVAIVTPQGEHFFSYGHANKSKNTLLNKNSLFQVGSITKLFTSSTASMMSKKGLISLDDKISKYFPMLPTSENESIRNITIDQILTHTSGLDRENESLEMLTSAISFLFTGNNLWESFNRESMIKYFNHNKVDEDKVGTYNYSNIAYVLLGEVINNIEKNVTYSEQVEKLLSRKLGLHDTVFSLNKEQETRLATGYVGSIPPFMKKGTPLYPWKIDESLWAAGSIYSSAKDLLSFLKINMGINKYEYFDVLKDAQIPRYKTESGYIGRAWFIEKLPNTKKTFINIRGYLSGYNSFIGFDKKRRVGVVVLQNTLNYKDKVGIPLLEVMTEILDNSPTSSVLNTFKI